MSLLITSVLVAGGVLLGRWIARGGRDGAPRDAGADEARPPEGASVNEQEPAKARGPARAAPREPFEGLPCKLGDVVMRTGGDEAWLAGAVVFREQHTVSALFVAPEARRDRAIYARAHRTVESASQLAWLEALPAGELAVGPEPPTSLEHAGVRYERARRLPVKVARFGTGAPDLGEQVIVAEYASSGVERLILVTGPEIGRAWVGVVLDEGMYEVIASGTSTLE
jgi:hypothetical protein